jgi:hypothetical protein
MELAKYAPPHPLPKVQIGTTIDTFSYDKHNNLFCKGIRDNTLLGMICVIECLDELVL